MCDVVFISMDSPLSTPKLYIPLFCICIFQKMSFIVSKLAFLVYLFVLCSIGLYILFCKCILELHIFSSLYL